MKVLDLVCAQGHTFEGWFGSEQDYVDQQDRGLLTCPVCTEARVTRRPSAPRLNLSSSRREGEVAAAPTAESAAASSSTPPNPAQALQRALVQAVQNVLRSTEDVGERFVEEARRIHYGEVQARNIRGQATPEQRAELQDEGIEVLTLPMLSEESSGPVH
jgi:hypothetical protein